MAKDMQSSKLKSIISKCDLIKKGSPSCYKLTTTTDIVGTLRRVTFGKKNPSKPNKTILLVGETGAGKSSLINALVNYTMGVKWEDEVWFQIVVDKNQSTFQSQTSDVILYEVFDFENKTLPYSLTIIDTPGYGNTQGIEHDVIVTQRLFDLFRSQEGFHEIDVVGLVVKASECRLNDRFVYILNSVMSLFGKDLEKNIVTLITYSNGVTPVNVLQALEAANIKCARNEKNVPLHFLFDNCQHQDRTKQRGNLQHAHEISAQEMRQFTDFLENITPQKLETTVEVMKEHIRLTACIQNLQDRLMLIALKQAELKQTQQALKQYEQEMKMNKEFEVEVNEPYKDKERINGGMWGLFFFEGAVCCTFCEENCHYPGCTMAWKPEHCEVIKDGRCTACTRKCLASAHIKEKYIYVTKTKKVQKTLTDVKEKYEKSKAASVDASSLLDDLQKEIENLEADKEKWIDMACQHVDRLNEIALKVDSVSTYVHLDFLIEKMKEKGDTEKLRTLKRQANLVNEIVRSGVKYAYAGLCKIFSKNNDNKVYTNV
ncbi:uncharacterized protein LOC120718831 [Simochromis diagramma]|uniref:uncharacterized protein LOC120718831 n=1 Tax=Simochromis diagramma TaxID=43689 RepID=UPI001A7E4263|nr:uncharacterized protein LOC120718831 [Simochromis diagramma]XP_039863485.1 uncharacterized protein LOC120718831 [Simochromis diagramma]XP_039863486.1 uncharacterized protein LOC120718831 [Simochromis diagramma]